VRVDLCWQRRSFPSGNSTVGVFCILCYVLFRHSSLGHGIRRNQKRQNRSSGTRNISCFSDTSATRQSTNDIKEELITRLLAYERRSIFLRNSRRLKNCESIHVKKRARTQPNSDIGFIRYCKGCHGPRKATKSAHDQPMAGIS
jgi:hypothetical protein